VLEFVIDKRRDGNVEGFVVHYPHIVTVTDVIQLVPADIALFCNTAGGAKPTDSMPVMSS